MNMPSFHMPRSLHLPKGLHRQLGQGGLTDRLSQIEMPEFLVDLYRDLRNRRLLPVAAVLAIAILAAPIALSSSGSKTAGAPSSSPAVAASSPFGAAVVAANHGIRELSKRHLGSAKDPFRQQAQVINIAGSQLGVAAASGPQSVVGSELGVTGTGGGGSTSGTSSGGSSGSSGTSGGSGGSGGGGSGSDLGGATLSTFAINFEVGEAGSNLESRKNVGYVSYLPSESTPVFVFVGVSQTGAKAFFLLPGAVSLAGDAECLLPVKPLGCQLIALKPGDGENVVSTGDGKTYRLKLDAIKQVKAP
jgi:hypothetical protein